MRRAPAVLAALLACAGASRAAAQDSVFGIRGLGLLDRGVSGKSAALGGGYVVFDPSAAVNPASLAGWHTTAGWAVGAGSFRSFDYGTGTSSLSATRFPVVGFAGGIGEKVVVAITASDYLDRNWSVQQTDTVSPRGTPVVASDNTQSAGGVTDLRLAMAYRLPNITVGFGAHVLTGSTNTSVSRQFPDDSAFVSYTQAQTTNYAGVGFSAGALVSPLPGLVTGASVRVNGRLRATTTDTAADVPMPVEVNAGFYDQPLPGLAVAGTVGWASWSRAAGALAAAGQARSRDVWSVGLGVEVGVLRLGRRPLPLRFGYRWRQLPFPIGGDATTPGPALSEHAVTTGLGFDTAGGRATVDLGLDIGSRAAGTLSESFTTLYVGLTIRP